jgi:hypothetical protein
MKYFTVIIYFGVVLISFNSCKKESAVKNTTNSTSVTGSWELLTVSGSIPPVNYPSGNGNIFEFTDSAYKKYTNGNLIKSGHYTVVQDASVVAAVGLVIPSGQFTNRIIFDNDTSGNKIFIEIQNNKLTFISGFFPLDGGSSMTYTRKDN